MDVPRPLGPIGNSTGRYLDVCIARFQDQCYHAEGHPHPAFQSRRAAANESIGDVLEARLE